MLRRFSALDTATEQLIRAPLGELSRGRTSLAVAHRLATARNADRIVVVGGGGLVEEGTHREHVARLRTFIAHVCIDASTRVSR